MKRYAKMNKKPFFSVIINNYNYGRYLEEAIDSVLAQNFPEEEREIIVVDDGSTDDSRERMMNYGNRIRCVMKDNGGQASALNAGMAAAEGEIIALLDSDDFWRPGKLFAMYEEFKRDESLDFIFHSMEVVDDRRRIIDRYFYPSPGPGRTDTAGESYRKAFLEGRLPWFPPTSGMTVRAECMRKALPIPGSFRIAADLYLHYILPFHIRRLLLVRKPLGYYRLHGSNLSGGDHFSAKKIRREMSVISLIRDEVEKHSLGLGLNADLLIRRMNTVVASYGILGDNIEGRKMKALKSAFFLKTALPGDGVLYSLGRKASVIISAVLPAYLYSSLQRTYRNASYAFRRKGKV
jgi:glycosyltransferase involved in cell wall biosynthesis